MERESNPLPMCRSGCGFYGNPATDGLCSVCYKDLLKKKQQPPVNSTPVSVSSSSVTGTTNASSTNVSTVVVTSQNFTTSVQVTNNTTNTAQPTVQSLLHNTEINKENTIPSNTTTTTTTPIIPTAKTTVMTTSTTNRDEEEDGDIGIGNDGATASGEADDAALLSQDENDATAGSVASDNEAYEHSRLLAKKRKFTSDDDSFGSGGPSTSNDDEEKDGDKDSKKKKNRCATCRKKVGLTGFECRCGGLFCAIHRYSDKHDCTFDYREHGAAEIRRNNPVVVGEKIQKI